MDKNNFPESKTLESKEVGRLRLMAELMDNRFRIPGTSIRFGLDSLVGLIPYAGDIFTFIVSGYLLILMSRRGGSGLVLLKMIWNILLDTVVGTIPLIGDLFDLGFRANLKNLRLMEEHIAEGKHTGSAWPIVLFIFLILLLLIALSLWLFYQVVQWIFS